MLCLPEEEVVLGNTENLILEAVGELWDHSENEMRGVILYTGCQTRFLGVDFDRVVKNIERDFPIFASCYEESSYTDTEEDEFVNTRKSVYESIFQLLPETKSPADSGVLLLSGYAAFSGENEMFRYLTRHESPALRLTSGWVDFDDFLCCGRASLQIVTTPVMLPVAKMIQKRQEIPYLYLPTNYRLREIKQAWSDMEEAVGRAWARDEVTADSEKWIDEARRKTSDREIALKLGAVARPGNLARALLEYGFNISSVEISVRDPNPEDGLRDIITSDDDLQWIAKEYPQIRIEKAKREARDRHRGPHGGSGGRGGKHSNVRNDRLETSFWGFAALTNLMRRLCLAVDGNPDEGEGRQKIPHRGQQENRWKEGWVSPRKHLWNRLLSFATDSTGVCSLFADADALVIGQDPESTAVKSYRMAEQRRDKISDNLGIRVDELSIVLGDIHHFAEKYQEALASCPRKVVVLLHSPVSSLTNLDLSLCAREFQKTAPGVEIFPVSTCGNRYYDEGLSQAFDAVLKSADPESKAEKKTIPESVNLLGLNTLDFPSGDQRKMIKDAVLAAGKQVLSIFGMETDLERLRSSPQAAENIVVSVCGLGAARTMEKEWKLPFTTLGEFLLPSWKYKGPQFQGSPNILIIGEQFSSNTLRRILNNLGAGKVVVAGWFLMDSEYMEDGDCKIESEAELVQLMDDPEFQLIIGDPDFEPLRGSVSGGAYFPQPHPPVSGNEGLRGTVWNLFSQDCVSAIVSAAVSRGKES
ncbi:MAG: hypothetical protein LBT22_01745 [Peptococcaceae bacterium]|jgi:nitrogenase molybdenum-iron protein alpha/beta subunit|nr:hypothetical protein [Peptococcaceae bacterium]